MILEDCMKLYKNRRKNKRNTKGIVEEKLKQVQALTSLTLRGMKHRVSLMMFMWIRFCSNILYYIYVYVSVYRESK